MLNTKLTNLDMSQICSMEVTPPGVKGVVLRGEATSIIVTIKNLMEETAYTKLVISVQSDSNEQDMIERREKFSINGLGTSVKEFKMPADKLGYWRINTRVEVENRTVVEVQCFSAVVETPVKYGQYDPDSFFGAMLIDDFEAASRIGVKIERAQAYWSFIDFENNRFYWQGTDNIDSTIHSAQKNGIGIILTVRPEILADKKPDWFKWNSDRELVMEPYINSYRSFVRNLAERYRGKLFALELLNEPDLGWFMFQGWSLNEAAEIVSKLNHEGYKVSKEVDPALPVLGLGQSGGDMLGGLPFTKAVLDRGAKGQFDFFAGHPYTSLRRMDEMRQEQWPEDYKLRELMIQAQDLMENYGLSREYWNTELGWAYKKGTDPFSGTAKRHAAVTARALIVARSVPDMKTMIWFCFKSIVEEGYEYGIVTDNLMPAACTYSTVARLLYNVIPAGMLEINSEIFAFRFDSPDGLETIVTLWDDKADLLLQAEGTDSLEIFDMYGRQISQGKNVSVSLSREPLYFRTTMKDGDMLVKALLEAKTKALHEIEFGLIRLINTDLINVSIDNRTYQTLDAKLNIDNEQWDIKLNPGMCNYTFRLSASIDYLHKCTRRISVVTENIEIEKEITFNEILAINKISNISIDGVLSEIDNLEVIGMNTGEFIYPPDPTVGWRGPEDLSARIWLGWSNEGLYFASIVTDDIHYTGNDVMNMYWNSDSIQLAIDPDNDSDKGYWGNDTELGIVLAPSGPNAFMTAINGTVERIDLPLSIVRKERNTIYEMLIPWDRLQMELPKPGKVSRINFVVNDNDGNGRAYWMGLTGGICEGKNPGLYKEFMFF